VATEVGEGPNLSHVCTLQHRSWVSVRILICFLLLLSRRVLVVGCEHKGRRPEGTVDAEVAETAAVGGVAGTLPNTQLVCRR
jgi:hypothetical protein